MDRIFKRKESDLINDEIVNKIYPVEALQDYYKFGYASALSWLEDMANTYINNKHADKLDAYDLKKLINEMAVHDKGIKEMFYRLRKDGIKTKTEEID